MTPVIATVNFYAINLEVGWYCPIIKIIQDFLLITFQEKKVVAIIQTLFT